MRRYVRANGTGLDLSCEARAAADPSRQYECCGGAHAWQPATMQQDYGCPCHPSSGISEMRNAESGNPFCHPEQPVATMTCPTRHYDPTGSRSPVSHRGRRSRTCLADCEYDPVLWSVFDQLRDLRRQTERTERRRCEDLDGYVHDRDGGDDGAADCDGRDGARDVSRDRPSSSASRSDAGSGSRRRHRPAGNATGQRLPEAPDASRDSRASVPVWVWVVVPLAILFVLFAIWIAWRVGALEAVLRPPAPPPLPLQAPPWTARQVASATPPGQTVPVYATVLPSWPQS